MPLYSAFDLIRVGPDSYWLSKVLEVRAENSREAKDKVWESLKRYTVVALAEDPHRAEMCFRDKITPLGYYEELLESSTLSSRRV